MPIVDVELVQPPSAPIDDGLAGRIADALAAALAIPAGRLWVRLRVLASSNYAENETSLAIEEVPVFATVLLSDHPPPEALERHAMAVATALSETTGRPRDRVHVEYAPAGRGRIAFGGRLLA